VPETRRRSRTVAGRNHRDPYRDAAVRGRDLAQRAMTNPRDPQVIAARAALEDVDAKREHAEARRQASKDVAGATDWDKASREATLNAHAREARADFDRTATQPRPGDYRGDDAATQRARDARQALDNAARRDAEQKAARAAQLRDLEQRGALRNIGDTPRTVSGQEAGRQTGDPDAVRRYQHDASRRAGVDLRPYGLDQADIRDMQRTSSTRQDNSGKADSAAAKAADARTAAAQARIRNAQTQGATTSPTKNHTPTARRTAGKGQTR
jgi:hypothetical protein